MLLRMSGLVKRGRVFQFRRSPPVPWRSVIGEREWTVSLDTNDGIAQARWKAIHEHVERIFSERLRRIGRM